MFLGFLNLERKIGLGGIIAIQLGRETRVGELIIFT